MPGSGIAPKSIMGSFVSGRQGVKGVVFFWRGRGKAVASAGPPPKKSPPPALRAPLDGLALCRCFAASRAAGRGVRALSIAQHPNRPIEPAYAGPTSPIAPRPNPAHNARPCKTSLAHRAAPTPTRKPRLCGCGPAHRRAPKQTQKVRSVKGSRVEIFENPSPARIFKNTTRPLTDRPPRTP